MPASPELKQQIENLALNLVMANPDSALDWAPAIREIKERALAEHALAVADAVASAEAGTADPNEIVASLQHAAEAEAGTKAPSYSLAQDPEMLRDFVIESRENLLAIETHILKLEREPTQTEALNAAFRSFHTIKGLAGFMELAEVQELSHEVETVLDRARNGQMVLTASAIDVILASADCLRKWVDHVDATLHHKAESASPPDKGLLERIRALGSEPEVAPPQRNSLEVLASAVESPACPPVGPAMLAVKVDTAKLDYLVDMAGEMVIAQTLVRHDPDLAGLHSAGLQRKMAQLTRISSELQRTAMAMRLVPIGPVFQRMGRLVRDLSRQFGKSVELETKGDDIELDRTIAEELADPLMHMVRNALDHGIESAAEREQSGKNPAARMLLKAQHQAGQVVVEVSDDGRGLDAQRIQAKAIEKGLISPEDTLTESEIHHLIFLPGFSTADHVTNISGRGVGMDVVRRHIEKLRGRIEVHSVPGNGATFLMKLPLTLAIIDGLVVRVGEERYMVPLFSVRELLRPGPDTIWTVEGRAEMALIRGAILPVMRLYRHFGVKPRSENAADCVLVVAEVESQRFGILVDELIGKQEVVIKPLGGLLRDISGIAGGAILGDGRVGLILDVEQIYRDRNSESIP
jgi:two-component system chemotaxis sensor kinase CheA